VKTQCYDEFTEANFLTTTYYSSFYRQRLLVPASQSLWWTETKQKKSNKFKDEFKIFHKLCSSQVKENLQYSQDFVASTILLDHIIIPVNSQKNSQQTISYPNTTS